MEPIRLHLQNKFQGMVTKYVGPQIQQILGYSIDDFRKAGNDFRYVLEPLKDLHLKGATQYNLEPIGSLTTVYIFAVIAILILIIAIINYVNLATAKSAGRAKEVGVKKVAGANKSGLVISVSRRIAVNCDFGCYTCCIYSFMPLHHYLISLLAKNSQLVFLIVLWDFFL